MRITCVLGPFLPVPPIRGGSVERIWLNLCTEFAARGHAVTLISRRFEGMPDEEVIEGVRFLRVPSTNAPKSKVAYRALDVLFSMRVCRALPASDITITNSVSLPLIIPRARAGKIYMSIARFPKGQMGFYRRVDRMQAVSSHVARAIVQQSPSIRRLVTSIPNAISTVFAQALAPDRGPREREIVFVGRVAREKGIDILIRAFALVCREFPDWRLTIIGPHEVTLGGDGEDCLAELKALAASLQAPLTFAGPIFEEAELARRFKQSDIFVYPSIAAKGEALPLAPVEAMACGCAIVLSSLDCFKDYLEDGANGLAFSEDDATGTALAAKLRLLLGDPALRDRLGRAAVETARRYTREAVATTFLTDFEGVVRTPS